MPRAAADIAGNGRRQHDQREGSVEKKDGDEGRDGDSTHDVVLQRARSDPHDRLNHHGQNRGLEAEEQPLNQRRFVEQDIDEAQSKDGEKARQHEQSACNQSAPGLVQKPADIGSELLCLGPGQQHAIVEGVQKALLPEPALLVDQDAVHHRDLPCRAAEAERRDPRPDPHGLAKGDAMIFGRSGGARGIACGGIHRSAFLAPQGTWNARSWPEEAGTHVEFLQVLDNFQRRRKPSLVARNRTSRRGQFELVSGCPAEPYDAGRAAMPAVRSFSEAMRERARQAAGVVWRAAY